MADRKVQVPGTIVNESELEVYNPEFKDNMANEGQKLGLTAGQHFTMLGVMCGVGLSDYYRNAVLKLAEGQRSKDSFLTACLRVKDYVDGIKQNAEDNGDEQNELEYAEQAECWVSNIVAKRAKGVDQKPPFTAEELRRLGRMLRQARDNGSVVMESDLTVNKDFESRLNAMANRIDGGMRVWA